jgi:Kdo2-lipid IVA lauroyltransferase/acyltransferase
LPGAAAPPAVVSKVVNATFGIWFPFFRWMTRNLPPVWVQRLAAATAERAIWARESVREAVLDNYAQILGAPRNSRRVETLAKEMISRHSRLWIDLLRHSGEGGKDASRIVTSKVGDEGLVEAHAEGKGAIILTAHVGNFELGGLFLKQLGLDVSAVYAVDPSPVIEAHREKARKLIGVEGIPVTGSPFAFVPILRALKQNRIVAIQGDRDLSGTGRRMPFLGRAKSFPVGPFRLAALAGAPVFPGFVLQEPDGKYSTRVLAPIRIETGAREAESIDRALETFVSLMEATIRERPEQWFIFTRFWE